VGKGPEDIMLSIINKYGLTDEVKQALESGVIMLTNRWKKKVKEKVLEKEHNEWIATC
jgi:hypothetical protein